MVLSVEQDDEACANAPVSITELRVLQLNIHNIDAALRQSVQEDVVLFSTPVLVLIYFIIVSCQHN